jgi:hypothetical protein
MELIQVQIKKKKNQVFMKINMRRPDVYSFIQKKQYPTKLSRNAPSLNRLLLMVLDPDRDRDLLRKDPSIIKKMCTINVRLPKRQIEDPLPPKMPDYTKNLSNLKIAIKGHRVKANQDREVVDPLLDLQHQKTTKWFPRDKFDPGPHCILPEDMQLILQNRLPWAWPLGELLPRPPVGDLSG